jgi:hypothetical protein
MNEFMLCIVLMSQLYRVLFYYHCSIILLLFDFHSSFVHLLFNFCFHSILLLFHCSLFVMNKKIFYSDPGLYSRYFDPAVPLYKNHHHYLCKSKNIIYQTAPSFS